MYHIKRTTSDPYYQWPDSAESSIQDLQDGAELLLDRTGADPRVWFKATILGLYAQDVGKEDK